MGRSIVFHTWNLNTTYTPGTLYDTGVTLYPNEYITAFFIRWKESNGTYSLNSTPDDWLIRCGFTLCDSNGVDYIGEKTDGRQGVGYMELSFYPTEQTGTFTNRGTVMRCANEAKQSYYDSAMNWSAISTKGQHIYFHPYGLVLKNYVEVPSAKLLSFSRTTPEALNLRFDTTETAYNISSASNPSAGGTITLGATSQDAGGTVSISATPNTGYTFSSWSVTGGTLASSTSASTTLTMPHADVVVTANFTPIKYALTVQASPSAGGTVTGSGTFNYGSVNNITATAAAGYTFNGWTTTSGTLANASNASTTITLGASAATVTASFVKINYSITTLVSPANSGSITAPSTAQMGDTVTLSQTPGRIFEFVSWSTNPAVTITNNQFTMPASNISITANYIIAKRIYYKNNNTWVRASAVYKKINGSWVLQNDLTTVFDSNINYIKGN